MTDDYIGWDIGGAHLKAAQIRGGVLLAVTQAPCSLWQGDAKLDEAWRLGIAALDATTQTEHVVTMTGELADCFADRREGVAKILASVAQYLQKPFKVYVGGTGFLSADGAARYTESIASANWHATAACLGKLLGTGVLLDIGSTTTDIVPFTATGAAAVRNDHERLQAGELVYTGVVRTPVMALLDQVRVGNQSLPVVAELFASSADIYRVLGSLPQHADQHPTCDGAAKTPEASARRLARMFGCDDGARDWTPHAQALAECQLLKIENALDRVFSNNRIAAGTPLVGAGVGRFLAQELAQRSGHPYVDFSDLFTAAPAADTRLTGDCASAVSLASLMHNESPVY